MPRVSRISVPGLWEQNSGAPVFSRAQGQSAASNPYPAAQGPRVVTGFRFEAFGNVGLGSGLIILASV